MEELSEFQNDCLKSVEKLLSKLDIAISDSKLEGKREKYLHIVAKDKNIEIWIYENECMFSYNNNDVHFERPDYSDGSNLIRDFISTVEKSLLGNDISKEGSGFVKLFDKGNL